MSTKVRIVFSVMFLILCTAVLAVHSIGSDNLKIVACDVGQGDSILMTRKDIQILIDGGPDRKVLECLDKNMPFWDRNIEVVILTHPQKDHYMGLIDVFETYRVVYFIANSLDASSYEYGVLKNKVGGSGAEVIDPTRYRKLRSGLIYLDILYPNSDIITEETKINPCDESTVGNGRKSEHCGGVLGEYVTNLDLNEFSIIVLARFKNFTALFTGDMTPSVSDEIAQILSDKGIDHINYIKIPHHGSKNGLTQKLVNDVAFDAAVISAGKSNPYGHPHKEVLDMLKSKGIRVLRTDVEGNIRIETDGNKAWLK